LSDTAADGDLRAGGESLEQRALHGSDAGDEVFGCGAGGRSGIADGIEAGVREHGGADHDGVVGGHAVEGLLEGGDDGVFIGGQCEEREGEQEKGGGQAHGGHYRAKRNMANDEKR
jgi:hypothetical protein